MARHVRKSPLTIPEILEWADAYRARTGHWPKLTSGPIPEAPGNTWNTVETALLAGKRGLPGKLRIARLLAIERGVRNRSSLLKLSEPLIFRWAKAHRRQHGRWPNRDSGPVQGTNGETWQGIDVALKHCGRGIKRRSSLAQLLRSRSQALRQK